MKMRGHKTRAIFARYYSVSNGGLREAARGMEEAQPPHVVTRMVTISSLDGTEKLVSH